MQRWIRTQMRETLHGTAPLSHNAPDIQDFGDHQTVLGANAIYKWLNPGIYIILRTPKVN